MKGEWPSDATGEERSLRLFKDALMKHAATAVALSAEDEEDRRHAAAEVEDAYARVRQYSPEELEGDAAPTYAEVLTALRLKSRGLKATLPPRRVLAHMLADLDYYFFALPGRGYVYDTPDLTDEERAAEHGLRHDLLLELYDELEPAFDVSLSWPPRGYEVDENGKLVETQPPGMAAIGFDCAATTSWSSTRATPTTRSTSPGSSKVVWNASSTRTSRRSPTTSATSGRTATRRTGDTR